MLLREIFDSTPTVGIIFGRFNPPHQGHRAAWELASETDQWFVGTNKNTHGLKDPLIFENKVEAMCAVWPEVKNHIITETDWFTLASKIYEQFGHVNLNCYTDEDWVMKNLINYNGKAGRHGYYDFKSINQVQTPRLSSATSLREAVINNDVAAFEKAAGISASVEINGKPYFNLVRESIQSVIEDAAGVGIVNKQNSTCDVGPGTLNKNLQAFGLTGTVKKPKKRKNETIPNNN